VGDVPSAERPASTDAVIDVGQIDQLIDALRRRDYVVVGPTLSGEAIVYDELSASSDLPRGWTDEQDGGRYRLERRDDDALFGYAVGPHSWKQFLFPPRTVLWRAQRSEGGFDIVDERAEQPRYAFLGVRSCDLHAMAVQDRVFLDCVEPDATYGARRGAAFVVVVQCGEPGGTCFCVSMGTGPRAESGFDLGLTELTADGRHEFLVEVGSGRGTEVLAELAHRPATPDDRATATLVTERAATTMGRTLDTDGIQQLLAEQLEHPRWDDVADRCLACTNCTLVCPTCFCSAVEDTTDLAGDAIRTRRWDSCFTLGHSYVHGGSVRSTVRARYRQWLTHKLGTWIDQFGTSGCVGCGRCISWCPVGIDLTEEVAALRAPTEQTTNGGGRKT